MKYILSTSEAKELGEILLELSHETPDRPKGVKRLSAVTADRHRKRLQALTLAAHFFLSGGEVEIEKEKKNGNG